MQGRSTDAESPWFFVHEGVVQFTVLGYRKFATRFRKAGFDIWAIKTLDDLERAVAASWPVAEAENVAALEKKYAARRGNAEVELLLAISRGDFEEADRLTKRCLRLRRSGFFVVK